MQRVLHNPILKFNDEEWLCFTQLLDKGYALADVLRLMNQSEEIIEEIIKSKTVEEIILSSMKGKKREYFYFFISFMSMNKAIESAVYMYGFEKKLKHEFIKQCAYPLFIFTFSFISVYLFSFFIIPQLLEGFDVEGHWMIMLMDWIRMFMQMFLFLLMFVLFIALMIRFYNPFKMRLINSKAIVFYRPFISYQLAGYLLMLHERGLSSYQTMQYLLQMKSGYVFEKCVRDINEHLGKGKEIIQVIRDCNLLTLTFKNAFVIGSSSGDIEKALASYMEQQKLRWNRQIKITTLLIQIFAYTFVGVLVICVYQIMMIPLQMIEQL